MSKFAASELILNSDGSIYHLNLLPEQISDIIFLVGDPDRVNKISQHFDRIDYKIQKREFITHTGWYKNVRFSALSTGIGTDNIDIVVNELDALANIDLRTREVLPNKRQLTLIRMGTSGALQEDITPGEIVVSAFAIGMDGLLHYYDRSQDPEGERLGSSFIEFCNEKDIPLPVKPYGAKGNIALAHRYFSDWKTGLTLTASGFYAPQSRALRAGIRTSGFINAISPFQFEGFSLTNMEMETAAIYGLSAELGHRALSINAILANRVKGIFAQDPGKVVEHMIGSVLDALTREA